MANTPYTNSVPLGEAGTGAAYILPQSQAISNIDDFIDNRARQQARALALQQQQAQQLAAAWKENQFKIKGGTLYQPEINTRAAKVMQMGMDLQKAGVNPNTISPDPTVQSQVEAYQKEKASLLQDVDARDAIVTRATANEKLLAQHPAGYFEPQGVQDYHDYVSGKIPLSEITGKGLQMPELKPMFNLQDAIKTLPSSSATTEKIINGHRIESKVPDVAKHAQTAIDAVTANPEIAADYQKTVGIPYSQVNSLSNKKDLPGITKDVDDYFRSNPTLLANQGLQSYNSPEYQQLLATTADKLFKTKKSSDDYLNQIVNHLNGKEDKVYRNTPYFGYEEEARAKRRMSMAETEFKQKQDDRSNTGVTYNIPGTAVMQTKIGQEGTKGPVTYPVSLPSINKTLVVNPAEIFNPVTGQYGSNTVPREVTLGSPTLMPFAEVRDDKGRTHKQFLNDQQVKDIQKGKFKIDGISVPDRALKYRYMISGVENSHEAETEDGFKKDADGNLLQDASGKPIPVKIPTGKVLKTEKPIIFDASGINTKLYDKDIDYNAIEKNLPEYVRNRIVRTNSGDDKVEKTISQSEIPNKAAAAGYSVKEYTDLLIKNGVKIK